MKYLIWLLLLLSMTPFPMMTTTIVETQNFLIHDQLLPQTPSGLQLALQYQHLLCRSGLWEANIIAVQTSDAQMSR